MSRKRVISTQETSLDKSNKIGELITPANSLSCSDRLLRIQTDMCDKLDALKFTSPIQYIYNPLKYAKVLHEAFVRKYFENSTKKILFLGMNPGPWGMCQTGIAFGEKTVVQDWLQLSGDVDKPEVEHPKKRVTGLQCTRQEVSGKKFWGFFKNLCQCPDNFFKHSFIYNHCCLAFLDSSGKNITPPEIKDANVRKQLYQICDDALVKIVREFKFDIVIAIGKFAEKNALAALKSRGLVNVKVYCIPHPSPRNAKNFSNWNEVTLGKLQEYNLLKYFSPAG